MQVFISKRKVPVGHEAQKNTVEAEVKIGFQKNK
jgi:hypothetical protein